MTPKERARKLVSMFYPHDSIQPETVDEFKKAKQHALTEVDVIINHTIVQVKAGWDFTPDYWQEVKKEIEKL